MVGKRELDGGAMVTASHNPKAYTGVKLVREGALALSGDTGITAIRDLILAGLGDPPGGGSSEGRRHRRPSSASAPSRSSTSTPCGRSGWSSTGATGWRARWSGRCSTSSRSSSISTYWVPDGNFPDHEPNPAASREPPVHHRSRPGGARRRRHRLGRGRRSLLLHRRRGRVRRRGLPDGAPGGAGARQDPGRRHPLRRPGESRGSGHGRRPRRHRPHQPGRSRDS